VKEYSASITPTTASAGGSQTYTVTITNSSTSCVDMQSATVVIPTGFAVTSTLTSSLPSGWTATLVSGEIRLVKASGSTKLIAGASMSVTFTATAPCANGPYEFTTTGHVGTDVTQTDYFTLLGSQPVVTVSGTCSCTTTYGQGHWKHASNWPSGVTSLMLGTVSYTQAEIISILTSSSPNSNGYIQLALQLIAAKLNVLNGAANTAAATIAAADTAIDGNVIPPVGGAYVAPGTYDALKNALEAYNNSCASAGSDD